MPQPESGTIREAHSGRVHNAGREEGENGKEEMEEWKTRHSRGRKRKQGDVGIESEKEKRGEEEGEKMESFFCDVHEFLTDYTNFLGIPAVSSPFVPVAFVSAALLLPSSSVSLLQYYITLFCLSYVL